MNQDPAVIICQWPLNNRQSPCHAVSALRLETYPSQYLTREVEMGSAGYANHLQERLAQYLYALHRSDSQVTYLLQYQMDARGLLNGISNMACYLFICQAGSQRDDCARLCKETAATTFALAQDLMGEYEWRLVDTERELLECWTFAFWPRMHISEIKRKPIDLRLDSRQQSQGIIGFVSPGEKGRARPDLTGDVISVLPHAQKSPITEASLLLNILARQGQSLALSILFQPTHLREMEKTELWESVSRCEGLSPVSGSLQRAQKRMAELARDHLLESLLCLQDRPYQLRVFMAGQQPLAESLCLLAGTYLFANAHVAGPLPLSLEVVRHEPAGLSDGGNAGIDHFFLPHLNEPTQEALERLSYLADTSQAASLFLLPREGENEISGICQRRSRVRPLVAVAQKAAHLAEDGATHLGVNVYQGVSQPVFISSQERSQHMYIVGKSGTGKTTLLKRMALSDIQAGRGVAVLDPHGDLFSDLLGLIPPERARDVVVFDPSNMDYPIGLNLLEVHSPEARHFVAREMKAVMRRLLTDLYSHMANEYTGPVFYNHLQMNMLLAMSDLNHPGTLLQLYEIFQRDDFWRRWLPLKWSDELLDAWVENILPKTNYTYRRGSNDVSLGEYINSKFTDFVFDPRLRLIFGQPQSTISLARIMNEGKILLVNLSKGLLGEANAQFLGLVLMAKLSAELMGRASIDPSKRRQFNLYVDEFQSLATENFSVLMSEARKFGLNLVLANQYISQIKDERILEAIFGNVGTLAVFRVGHQDAERVHMHFRPSFNAYDLINLPNYQACVRVAGRGGAGSLFSMQTSLPECQPDSKQKEIILEYSRNHHGRPRQEVESLIRASLVLPEKTSESEQQMEWMN